MNRPLSQLTGTGQSDSQSPMWWLAPLGVAIAAILMGLPTLDGSFVGGDDHRLVLNHVLVNHPSLEHAVKLFTIWHRDLYQPLALLSFQAEFAIADSFGLFDRGLEGGQWLFHLTNIVLHAVNTLLVWFLIITLHERAGAEKPVAEDRQNGERKATLPSARHNPASPAFIVATISALLFAIHPFQTEVVAWTNGRMMLLSTLFGLLAMLAFAKWLDHARKRSAVLTVVWVLLSGLSKVRVGLPILLAVVALTRHRKSDKRLIVVWTIATLITGIFAVVNILSTSEAKLFSEGAEYLLGPRFVRVLLALAFYTQHLVWPVGLASYYPTPPLVQWSDPGTWHAIYVLVPAIAVTLLACWRSRVARLGTIWFFATIGATLPLLPARNVLAADRYMYLPIIGLLWLLADFTFKAYQRWLTPRSVLIRRTVVALLTVLVVVPSLGMCRHIAWFYATPLRKTQRISSLFPTTPRVWERQGWTHYGLEQYDEALQCARRELPHTNPNVLSGAYQLMGMAKLRLGDPVNALDLLQQAIDTDAKNVLAIYRMAMALDELGRTEEAISYYETAVEKAPLSNPTIHRLATAYRRVGRNSDARRAYEQALANNPTYEIAAILGLVELDIEEASRESYLAAEHRLVQLLSWSPKHSVAWANLGVVRQALGRSDSAVEAYQTALQHDPRNVFAALNLGQLYAASGRTNKAATLFDLARKNGIDSVAQAIAIHDFYISQGAVEQSIALWSQLEQHLPGDPDCKAFAAWTLALAGRSQQARSTATAMANPTSPRPLAIAAIALADLEESDFGSATSRVDQLCAMGDGHAALRSSSDVRRRFLGALERYGQRHPESPWTFILATRLLIANRQLDAANASVHLGEDRCKDAVCSNEIAALREVLSNTATSPSAP